VTVEGVRGEVARVEGGVKRCGDGGIGGGECRAREGDVNK
jgi:hypothetical protein